MCVSSWKRFYFYFYFFLPGFRHLEKNIFLLLFHPFDANHLQKNVLWLIFKILLCVKYFLHLGNRLKCFRCFETRKKKRFVFCFTHRIKIVILIKKSFSPGFRHLGQKIMRNYFYSVILSVSQTKKNPPEMFFLYIVST